MIDSLPSRPLRRNEVTALEAGDAIDFSKQLAEKDTPDDEAVIGLYLAIRDNSHLLGYTPGSGWEKIASLTETAEMDMMEVAVDQFLDWLDSNYDNEDVAVTIEDHGVETGLLNLLPDRPVGKSEVLQLDEHPTLDVLPLFALKDTHEIVCVTGVEVSLGGQLTGVTVGYLPEIGWDVISTETNDLGEPVEPGTESTIEWIDEHYADDVIAIDNRNQM